VSLDVRRAPAHRRRSRFLALMEFLGTGFARRIGGPDLVAGRALGRLHEEWEYAWTPLVEAALIELAVDGTLDAAARARLAKAERELAETGGRSAAQAVSLLVQAAVIGLADELPRLRTLVRDAMDADPSLDSVVGAGHRLARLIEARDQLDLDDPAELQALLAHVVPTAAFLVPSLGLAPAEAEDAAVGTLVSLRDLVAGLEADVTPVHRELERLRHDPTTAPGVAGALHAHAALDGEVSDDEFVTVVVAQLGAGADVDRAVRFLSGVMRAAPDLLLHDPAALAAVHRAVVDLPADTFLAYLPDLRRAFSWLKPSETDRLAERIAAGVGVAADAINAGPVGATGAELAQGVALERRLVAGLTADGLGAWTEEVA